MRKVALGLLFTIIFLECATAQTKIQSLAETEGENYLPKSLGAALGRYDLNLSKDEIVGFDFEFFRLYALPGRNVARPIHDRDGRVRISGSLVTVDGTYYPFLSAFLKSRSTGEYEEIEFVTTRVKGISYHFKGKFSEKFIQEKPGRPYSDLRGIIIKTEKRKVTSSQDLPFTAMPDLPSAR